MRLGLLAMSGVRAHDPELTVLGLTLPGFVERNHVIASLPSLGLLTLAGGTPESIDVEYADVPDVSRIHGCPASSMPSPSRASARRSKRPTNWRIGTEPQGRK